MEPLSQKIVTRSRFKKPTWAWLIVGPCLLAGCVSTEKWQDYAAIKPTGTPCKVVATWHPEVAFTPDPANGGVPSPGFAGRIYLFGKEMNQTFLSDGSVHVDLYAEVEKDGKKDLVLLERWDISKENLKLLEKRDPVGWGYTLFLPWGSYNKDMKKVQLRLSFLTPSKGAFPLYADNALMTLNRGIAVQSTARQELLGEHAPVAQK